MRDEKNNILKVKTINDAEEVAKTSPYSSYKQSKSQWIKNIPSHWDIKKLKFIANVQPSNVDKKTIRGEENVLLCNYTDVYKNEYINSHLEFMQATATKAEIRKFSVDIGDVIVTKDSEDPTDIAIPACASEKIKRLLCGYHLTHIKPLGIDGRYLFRLFQSSEFNTQFIVAANGVTRYGLPQYSISNSFTPIPPIEEQKTIAKFLDYKTEKIDALIAKKKELLEKLEEKRTALISHAVTKGLDPSVPMRDSGIDWLGEIPEHWEALPLRRLVDNVKTGSTPSGVNEIHFEESGLNWFKPGDFTNSFFLNNSEKKLSEEGVKEVRVFPPNTVMHVGIGATIGKVGIINQEASCNQQVNAISCNSRLNPVYAVYYLQSIKEFIVKCGKYTTLPIINQDETKELIFTVPPIEEQSKIKQLLLNEENKINNQKKTIHMVIEKLKEYRSAIITNAVTGKIDVRSFRLTDTDKLGNNE